MSKYSENPADKNAGSVTKIGGSARMSVEGSGLDPAPCGDGMLDGTILADAVNEDVLVVNKCGCSNRFMRSVMIFLLVLVLIFMITALSVSVADKSAAGVVWIFALLCLIALIVSCCVRYCTVCQYPEHDDEHLTTNLAAGGA